MTTRFLKPLIYLLPLVAAIAIGCGDSDKDSKPAPAVPAAQATTAPALPEVVFKGGPSTELQLTGLVGKPGIYKLPELKFITKNTVTTNAQAGNSTLGEHSYSGPLLFDLIMAAEPKQDSKVPNDLLRRAVVVYGSDGYKASFAWGEIDPRFAGKKYLMAYERDGQPLPEPDGFARLVVAGDVFAGRYISNVVKVEVKDSLAAQPTAPKKSTTAFSVKGSVEKPGDINLARLQGLRQTTVTVDANGAKTTYSGVLLSDFLTDVAIKIDPNKKNDILNKGIVAVGADGSAGLVVGGESEPRFGNVQALIAIIKDGIPLGDADGFARLVVPGDAQQGRFVSNLMRIEVVEL